MAVSNASTETAVANLALDRLGLAIISDIDTPGTDKAALACSRVFADTRDEVSSMFPWASIAARTALSTTAATDSRFDYFHTLATPFLYVFEVVDILGTQNIDFRIEGTKLYTDVAAGYLRHVSQATTVADWGPALLEAIVLRLATKLAVKLAGDIQLSALMQQEFITIVSVAMATKAIWQHEDNEKILSILNQQMQVLLLQQAKVVE